MIAPEKNPNPAKGILLVIIAFFGFSVMSTLVKACSQAGVTTQGIMFVQNGSPWRQFSRGCLRDGKPA